MIKRLYNRYIGSKFLVKLILTYSIIVFISIFITGNIITNNFLAKMEREEIENQRQVISKLKTFTERKYNKVRRFMFQLHVPSNSKKSIAELFVMKELSTDKKEKIKGFLQGLTNLDKDIMDIILVKDNNHNYFYSSTKRDRYISPDYDFFQNKIINKIKKSRDIIQVFSDIKQEYILGKNYPVMSIAGNIYNLNKFPAKETTGKYIVNISTDLFLRAYNEYSGKTKGNLLIINDNGEVLFDSNNKYQGTIYPYFEEVLNHDSSDIILEEPSIVNWIKSELSGISIIMVTPKSRIIRSLKQLKNRIFTIIFICIAITLVPTLLVSRIFASRIKVLASCMQRVQAGEFDIKYASRSNDEISQLGRTFNQMCKRLKEYIEKVFVAEIETKKAELSSLRSQINPHFLYNTLEMIRMKAHSNQDEEVADMLATLGKLFRWNVKDKDNIVSIEDEIDYIKHYLELQKMRDPEKLKVETNLGENVLRLGIPKLLLQPIVENSLYHGLFAKKGKGVISISVYQEESEVLHIEIKDNGVGMGTDQLEGLIDELDEPAVERDEYYIGLSNVHQRIKLLFGEDFGLQIRSEKGQGTEVCVNIPALTKMEMEDYVQAINSR